MDVKTICLGLLSFGDACGYDLKKTFESLFKHFFPAGYGSIYPALADLADSGLVQCREIPQARKPDRKVYRITETGRQTFLDALYNAEPQHKIRSEFLATIYFSELMDAERVGALIDDRIEKFREAVTHIENIERQWGPDTSPGARFVAGFGTVIAKAAAEYVESNRHLLTRSDDDKDFEQPKAISGN
jgi:DNA-binding PadR family transcriptional regulator